jgi:hypothetical protein
MRSRRAMRSPVSWPPLTTSAGSRAASLIQPAASVRFG